MSNDKVSTEVANECINAALEHANAKITEQAACIAKLQDSLVNAKKALLAYEEAPIQSAEVAEPNQFSISATLREYADDPGYSHNDYADTMRQAADAIDALAAIPAQPAGDVSAPTDDDLVKAWFAANNKYIVVADFDAWLEQAYRDGLEDARAAAPVSQQTDALTYTVDGVRMSQLEYISHLHGLLQKAAPVSGQGASVRDDTELMAYLANFRNCDEKSRAYKFLDAAIERIDSRPRSEDSRAKVLEEVYEVSKFSVCIPVTIEQFEAIDAMDYLSVVMPALNKLGADEIEYNGHFGSNVFLSVESLDKMPAIIAKLESFVGPIALASTSPPKADDE